jgi:hypothetical protein
VQRESGVTALPLDRIQRWLQAVIVRPEPVGEALLAPEAAAEIPPDDLERVVRPSWSLTAAERVDVYHGMYLLRMVEALQADYPAVRHTLGEEAFVELVRAYTGRYPSCSYTLNRLGDHLPRFFLDEPDRPESRFLHDLARAELAITEVFDEEDSPVLGADALRGVAESVWASVRLRPIRAFRLLALRHPVSGHLEAAKHGRPTPRARRRASFMVVYRRDYSVFRLDLGRSEYELLNTITAGVPLGEALAAGVRELRQSRREKAVFRAFRTWVAEGMFSAIDRAPATAVSTASNTR